MVFNRKMTKEAGSNVSTKDCLVLHKYSQGLRANLSGKGKRRGGEMVRCSSSSHYLAPAGGGAVQTARGNAGAASCLCTVDPIGQARYTQASMLLLFF